MDRKELFEQALKETNSLTEAVKLVKEIEGFIGSAPVINITPVQKAPVPPIPKNTPISYPWKSPGGKGGYKSKRWTADEISIAETMFNANKSFEQVAKAIDRSVKSIRNALSANILKPTVDPRNEGRRAASLKGHITFGRKLKNYEEAQALIDQTEEKKKV